MKNSLWMRCFPTFDESGKGTPPQVRHPLLTERPVEPRYLEPPSPPEWSSFVFSVNIGPSYYLWESSDQVGSRTRSLFTVSDQG